jgi:hypothetical protein
MSKVMGWWLGAACIWGALAFATSCGADDDDAGAAGALPGGSGGGASGVGAGGGGAAAGTSASGCGTESFAAIYQDIFTNQAYACNSPVCHGKMPGQTASVGNLELMTKDLAYMDLVGVSTDSVLCGDMPRTRVVKGNAAGSLLIQKLRAATVTCGSIMPVTGVPITDPELARITAWINNGACNN